MDDYTNKQLVEMLIENFSTQTAILQNDIVLKGIELEKSRNAIVEDVKSLDFIASECADIAKKIRKVGSKAKKISQSNTEKIVCITSKPIEPQIIDIIPTIDIMPTIAEITAEEKEISKPIDYCAKCGRELFANEEITMFDGEPICEDCFADYCENHGAIEVYKCSQCGRKMAEQDVIIIDDKIYCENCEKTLDK